MPDQGQLDIFRSLLSGARQREKSRVPKHLAEVRADRLKCETRSSHRNYQLIEHDFVEERKSDKSITQHDLAMKITIARYGVFPLALCISLQQSLQTSRSTS